MAPSQIVELILGRAICFVLNILLFRCVFNAPWWAALVGGSIAADIAVVPNRIKYGA